MMGLLQQGNPNATRRTLILHAALWGTVMLVAYIFAAMWIPILRTLWWLLGPIAVLFGAGVGALMEWQLDDGDDEDLSES